MTDNTQGSRRYFIETLNPAKYQEPYEVICDEAVFEYGWVHFRIYHSSDMFSTVLSVNKDSIRCLWDEDVEVNKD